MDNLKGNTTTIITWIALLILPYVATYGITHEQLVALISSIVGIIWAIINSKYPNTFKCLGNNTECTNKIITTDELSTAIKEASQEIQEEEITVEHDEVIGDDQQ